MHVNGILAVTNNAAVLPHVFDAGSISDSFEPLNFKLPIPDEILPSRDALAGRLYEERKPFVICNGEAYSLSWKTSFINNGVKKINSYFGTYTKDINDIEDLISDKKYQKALREVYFLTKKLIHQSTREGDLKHKTINGYVVVQIFLHLSRIFQNLDDTLENYEKAHEYANFACELNPTNALSYQIAGIAARKATMKCEGLQSNEHSVLLAPDRAETNIGLSIAWRDFGYPEYAIEHARNAIRLNENKAEGYKNLAHAFILQEEYWKAAGVLRSAMHKLKNERDELHELERFIAYDLDEILEGKIDIKKQFFDLVAA